MEGNNNINLIIYFNVDDNRGQSVWDDNMNRENYVLWLAEHLKIEHPEQWNEILGEDFKKLWGRTLLHLYNHSVYKILSSLFGEYRWKAWLFDSVPNGYWQNPIHQKEYLDWFALQMNIKTPEDW
jgi:hypothetical protein